MHLNVITTTIYNYIYKYIYYIHTYKYMHKYINLTVKINLIYCTKKKLKNYKKKNETIKCCTFNQKQKINRNMEMATYI